MKPRKTWRCFHCDEVFRSRKQALLHFGDADYEGRDVPACVDPLRTDEKARMNELREAQRYALQCQEESREADDRAEQAECELIEFKRITKCNSAYELRMWLDYQQGRVVTADALIEGFRQQDPQRFAEVIG